MTTETQAQAQAQDQIVTQYDIARRVAEALGRTGEPKPCSEPENFSFSVEQVIGTVPEHLRHMHNLLEEMGTEVLEQKRILALKIDEAKAVQNLFFTALAPYAPPPERACTSMILPDWSVAVGQAHHFGGSSLDDGDPMGGGLSELLSSMLGAGRR